MSEAPLELDLSSDPRSLPDAREKVRRWAGEHEWNETQIGEVVLALDEALTNVIRHAYGGQSGKKILVTVQAIQDPDGGDGLEIRVRDFGRQVNPEDICGRDLDDIRPGGLGVHIIQALNDSVEYRCAEGGGMLLVMRKFKAPRVEKS